MRQFIEFFFENLAIGVCGQQFLVRVLEFGQPDEVVFSGFGEVVVAFEVARAKVGFGEVDEHVEEVVVEFGEGFEVDDFVVVVLVGFCSAAGTGDVVEDLGFEKLVRGAGLGGEDCIYAVRGWCHGDALRWTTRVAEIGGGHFGL